MDVQEAIDRFYWANGKCCAGCDYWRSNNGGAGECRAAAPMSGDQRMSLLGITGSSLHIGAGHPITPRFHHCGDFKDEFDWHSLPLGYRARIGAPRTPPPHNRRGG
jgi:hypothetical protein